jgi:hypothetical protein
MRRHPVCGRLQQKWPIPLLAASGGVFGTRTPRYGRRDLQIKTVHTGPAGATGLSSWVYAAAVIAVLVVVVLHLTGVVGGH